MNEDPNKIFSAFVLIGSIMGCTLIVIIQSFTSLFLRR
jgi:hypothetical protein